MWGSQMMGYGWGWMPFMGMIFWLLILVLVVAGMTAFMRAPWRPSGETQKPELGSPGLRVLEERYARGEIPRDEYLQKKKDILGSGAD